MSSIMNKEKESPPKEERKAADKKEGISETLQTLLMLEMSKNMK